MLSINKIPKPSRSPVAFGKVSIIITNFKKEKFLKKAILSCLRQSYLNIEVLVVDDCSDRDSVRAIIKSVRNKRVRFLYTTKNYGHYACANYAMDKASGRYITFLGADDTIGPNHVLNLILALNKHKLMGVCSLYSRYHEDGNRAGVGGKLCEASILFEKNKYLKNIGYFHMTRCAADTEYRERAIKYFGKNRFGILKVDSYKALYSETSLTRSPATGRNSSGRKGYTKRFFHNIKVSKRKDLYFNYKSGSLSFPIPDDISVKDFDLKTFGEERV